MKIKAAIMGLVIVAFAVSGTSSFAQAKKPNIIIIWEDDIGQSNISAYSHWLMGYRTPNIDRVAREGVIGIERNVDGAIRTSVRDYGVGIPEEARAGLRPLLYNEGQGIRDGPRDRAFNRRITRRHNRG